MRLFHIKSERDVYLTTYVGQGRPPLGTPTEQPPLTGIVEDGDMRPAAVEVCTSTGEFALSNGRECLMLTIQTENSVEMVWMDKVAARNLVRAMTEQVEALEGHTNG
jgi:hypothetical protein